MYILGFDTSSSNSHVSISNGPDIIYVAKDPKPNAQAENLIAMIEEAFSQTGLDYGKIDYIAASAGPGSFTGIRIALAAARGIIIACPHIKPVCVNNFQTINFRIRQQFRDFDRIVTFVNAYRDQLYVQEFSRSGSNNRPGNRPGNAPIGEPQLLYIEEARSYLESLEGVIAIGGGGIEQIYTSGNLPPKNILVAPRFAHPDGRFICRVAHQHIVSDSIDSNLDPLYIRAPDAKLPGAVEHKP